MRRRVLIEVSYTPGELVMSNDKPVTKKEIYEEERRILEYLRETVSYDFHENGNLKFKIVKNDTSRIQNRKK